ncbi:MAG: RICIN domain-containing protein [Bacteroidales bacterium]|nr:RICIN domain-containing protein [Bacteroidales bacterium]
MKTKKSKKIMAFSIAICMSIALTTSLYAEGDGYGANNGGNSGTAVTVTTASQLATYAGSNSAYNITVSGTIDLGTNGVVKLGSNTTLQGANTSATIIGTINITGVSNVIVKNLNITAPTGDPGDNDGVQIRGGATGILITKCNIYNCTDGCLDVTHGGATATISWCKFYYTWDNGHNFACLIGASDDDYGTYKLTYHHNWWAQGCDQRMTASRFGPVHFYNNYFSCTGNYYCTTSRTICEMLAQNNYYDGVSNPLAKEGNGRLRTSGNIFNNCTGNQVSSSDAVFTPPYSYSLTSTSSVPSVVKAGAGNVGSSSSTTNGTFNGTYSILASHSGKALDVYAWGTSNGTNICQWSYWGGATQQFNVTPVDGIWHRITPVLSTDKALDVYGISTASGANICIWEYWGGYGQQYRFQNAGSGVWRIIARHSEKCLDVAGASTADGANVQQWTCTAGSAWQMFQMVSLKSAENATGAIEKLADGIAVYPNPVVNNMYIGLPEKYRDNVSISVFNSAGARLILEENITATEYQMDLSGLKSGIYVLMISNGRETLSHKFSKN